MPSLINVFLGSPSDISDARATAKDVFTKLNIELLGSEVHFACWDYKDLPSHTGVPQAEGINPFIERSSLVILFFGKKVGKGTLEEFELAIKLHANSSLLDLMIYFQKNDENSAVEQFKSQIQDKILFHEFTDMDSLKNMLIAHLRVWSANKRKLFDILNTTIPDRGLLMSMQAQQIIYSDEVKKAIRLTGREVNRAGKALFEEYLKSSITATFWDEVKYFLIAKFLCSKINANDYSIFQYKPFINPIHQHLAKIINDSNERSLYIETLISWLNNQDKVFDTSRNFAAFVLGMISAKEATTSLLEAIKNPRELFEVRYYAIHSIGMIKSKACNESLERLLKSERNEQIRTALITAIHYINQPQL